MPPIVLRRWASERTPNTTAPASAAQAGDRPANEVTAKPANVSPSTTSTNTGCSTGGGASAPGASARSRRNTTRNTAYSTATASSHGAAINALNRVNDSPAALNASRLVRFDTGSSSEAVFDRCAVAYRCGRGGTRSARTVASTTGVSSTTVASRLRIAVVAAAITNTCPSSRRGRPVLVRAIHAPAASNRPSSSHRLASTSTAARNATTGSMRPISAVASPGVTAPIATRMPAAGTASTASGHPAGRAMAKTRTTASRTSEMTRLVKAQTQGSARCHTVGRCRATPSRSASRDSTRIVTSRSSPA